MPFTNATDQLLLTSQQKFAWQTAGNADAYAQLLVDDGRIVHADGTIQSKQEFVDHLRSAVETAVHVRGIHARTYGTTGVVIGEADLTTVDANAETTRTTVVFTETYVLDNTVWRLIAAHHAPRP